MTVENEPTGRQDCARAAREARADEAERCALLAEDLAGRWERSGQRMRDEGTYYVRALWPPFRKTKCVTPRAERNAKDIDSAAYGLRAVARGCREGWDTRKLLPHEQGHGMAVASGVDGDPTLVKLSAKAYDEEMLKALRC